MYAHSNANKFNISSSPPPPPPPPLSSSPLPQSPSSIFTSECGQNQSSSSSSPPSSPPPFTTPTAGKEKRRVTQHATPAPLQSAGRDGDFHTPRSSPLPVPPIGGRDTRSSPSTPGAVSADANISRRLFVSSPPPPPAPPVERVRKMPVSSPVQLSDALREAYFPGGTPPPASHPAHQTPMSPANQPVVGARGTAESTGVVSGRATSTPSRLLPWKRDGGASNRVPPTVFRIPETGPPGGGGTWSETLEEMIEVADRVVKEFEEHAEKSRCSTTPFQPVILPTNDLPSSFSTPMPGREEIYKLKLNKPSGYFAHISALNKECERRAICLDDPDLPPIPAPHYSKQKDMNVPLHQSLKNRLPSSSVFRTKLAPKTITEAGVPGSEVRVNTYTVATYRSKHDNIADIERASAGPNMPYEDKHFGARVAQYRKNKDILEAAMNKSGVDQTNRALSGKKANHHGRNEKSNSTATLEASLKTHILRTWELERDIDRLEALKRSVVEARTRISQLRWTMYSDVQAARGRCRFKATDSDDEDEREYIADEEIESVLEAEMTSSTVDAVPNSDTQLHRSVDLADVYALYSHGESEDGGKLSDGESSRFDEDPEFETGTVGSRRSTPVYSALESTPESGTVMPVAESAQLDVAGAQEQEKIQSPETSCLETDSLYSTRCSSTPVANPAQLKPSEAKKPEVEGRDRDRAEAHKIVRGLGSVSRRMDRSGSPSTRVSTDGYLTTSERSEQSMRGEEAASPSLAHQEERYPKMKNIVQQ